MATNKLVKKTLGNILVQSGEGSPDHFSTNGTLYTDILSGILYQYKNDWIPLEVVGYGEYGFQDNTTSINMTTSWTKVNNILRPSSIENGISLSGSSDKIEILRDGNYLIKASMTITSTDADDNIIRVGIAHNNLATDIHSTGFIYQKNSTDQKQMTHIGIFGLIKNVIKNDTISFIIKSETASAIVIAKHATIFIKRKI